MAEMASQTNDGQAAREGWDETCPDTEQRATARFTLLIRTAKLIAASGEYLCVVRDVSSDGSYVHETALIPNRISVWMRTEPNRTESMYLITAVGMKHRHEIPPSIRDSSPPESPGS